jgi:hypothetical protein
MSSRTREQPGSKGLGTSGPVRARLAGPDAASAERAARDTAAEVVSRQDAPAHTNPLQSMEPEGDSHRKVVRETGHEGLPLDASTRAYMEPRFGVDFSAVRVHRGDGAARSAAAQGARAYAYGRDIVFGEGTYDPASRGGRTLLAHELTHVVQQNGRAPTVQRDEKDAASIGKYAEPEELAKWKKTLESDGYRVYTKKDMAKVPWIKKAFPDGRRRPDLIAVRKNQVLVGDIAPGPWSDVDARFGEKRQLPNDLETGTPKMSHMEKTVDDARQAARNLPDDMKDHKVVAKERWWKKGGYSKEVVVKRAGAPMEKPPSAEIPGPRPLKPPAAPRSSLFEPPAPKTPFKVDPARVDSATRGQARGLSSRIFSGDVEEGAGGKRGGRSSKPRGGGRPRGGKPSGGHPLIIIGQEVAGRAIQEIEESSLQEEIESEVRAKLAGRRDDIQKLFDANVKEIFANVTVTTKSHAGGSPQLDSVAVAVDSKQAPGGATSDDGIFTRVDIHKYSFRLFDVAAEKERQRLEAEQSELAGELHELARQREKLASESTQGKGPLKPQADTAAAGKKPAPPNPAAAAAEFLKPPGHAPQQAPFSFFPGMSTSDPIREARQWTDNARAYALQLITRGTRILETSAPEAQRNQWKVEVSQWFKSLQYMKNWFTQQSRSEAVNACGEMLDRQGGEMRNLFGAM